MVLPPNEDRITADADGGPWSWTFARNAEARWKALDLARQFMLVTSIALILGMQFIGYWVSHRIGEGIIATHGVTAALYAESFVETRIQELATKDTLTQDSREAPDGLVVPQGLGQPQCGCSPWRGSACS